jgi:threonine/homoserine/homoserine lactone efflux protein
MLLLGGIHVVTITVVYFAVALLARRILRSRPRASAVVTRVAGIAMTLIGAGLLIEKSLELFSSSGLG